MKIIILVALFLTSCVTEEPLTGKKKEDAIQSYIDLAYGYMNEGQTELAKSPLNSALKLDKYHQEANVALANVFQKESEYKLAYTYYQNALKSNNTDAETNSNMANFLYQQKRYSEALGYYKVAEKDPLYSNRSLVLEAIGLTYSKMSDYKKAKEYLTRALQVNNSLPMSYIELANIYYLEGKYESALGFYNMANKYSINSAYGSLIAYKIYSSLKMRDEMASLELKMKNIFGNTYEYSQFLEFKKKIENKSNSSNDNFIYWQTVNEPNQNILFHNSQNLQNIHNNNLYYHGNQYQHNPYNNQNFQYPQNQTADQKYFSLNQ